MSRALAALHARRVDAFHRCGELYGFACFSKTEGIAYLMAYPKWLEPRRAAMVRIDAPESGQAQRLRFLPESSDAFMR